MKPFLPGFCLSVFLTATELEQSQKRLWTLNGIGIVKDYGTSNVGHKVLWWFPSMLKIFFNSFTEAEILVGAALYST